MADANKDRFEARLRGIEEKTKPGRRVQQRVTEDGLIVEVAKSDRRRLFPIKTLLMAAVVFVTLKGFLFAQLGSDEYQGRIDTLSRGSAVEVAAAFLLDADPVTQGIAEVFRSTLP